MVSENRVRSLRCAGFLLAKVFVLSLLAALGPACTKSHPTPSIINGTPLFGASSVAHFPLIVLKWSEAMNLASVTTAGNIQFYDFTTAAPQAASVIYLAGSNETIVINQTSLASPNAGALVDGTFVVGGTSNVMSAAGGALPAGGINQLDQFTVIADSDLNVNPPSFSGVVATQGTASGSIDLTFALAQETVIPAATPPVQPIVGFYDVYMATSSGGEDLIAAASFSVASGTAASNANTAGLAATQGRITIGASPLLPVLNTSLTYYFIVVARDSHQNVGIANETTGIKPTP